ncbi:hypothetical protein BGZ94_004305 [Podila epigama]|nr:hypothetical protein BGZ94_004305 [Podila epigama]
MVQHDDRESKGLLKLFEFSQLLAHNSEAETLQYWNAFVARFFVVGGRMRFRLVNPTTNESKIFELLTSSLPTFYHTNCESGVQDMQLLLERTVGLPASLPYSIECPTMTLVSNYSNGSKVVTKGMLKVTFSLDYRFESLEFSAVDFKEYIPRPTKEPSDTNLVEVKQEGKKKTASKKAAAAVAAAMSMKRSENIPESVVNDFGVSDKTMRILEISDVFSKMSELIQFSAYTKRGATEALASYSQLLRERTAALRPHQPNFQSPTGSLSVPMKSGTLVQPPSHNALLNNSPQPHVRASSSPRSVKRCTSTGFSPNDSGIMSSPVASPVPEDVQTQGGAVTVTPTMSNALMNTLPSVASQTPLGVGVGLGLGSVGSPLNVPSSLITSPIFTPTTALLPSNTNTPSSTMSNTPAPPLSLGPSKSSKRVRTASAATPTLGNATITNTASSLKTGVAMTGVTSSGGRHRKGAGKKDSVKRKSSLAETTGDSISHNINGGSTAGGGKTSNTETMAGSLGPTAAATSTGPITAGSMTAGSMTAGSMTADGFAYTPGLPDIMHSGMMNGLNQIHQQPASKVASTPVLSNVSASTIDSTNLLHSEGPRTPVIMKSRAMSGIQMPTGTPMGMMSMNMTHPGQFFSTMVPNQAMAHMPGVGGLVGHSPKNLPFHGMALDTISGLSNQGGLMSGPHVFESLTAGNNENLNMSVLANMDKDSSSVYFSGGIGNAGVSSMDTTLMSDMTLNNAGG